MHVDISTAYVLIMPEESASSAVHLGVSFVRTESRICSELMWGAKELSSCGCISASHYNDQSQCVMATRGGRSNVLTRRHVSGG